MQRYYITNTTTIKEIMKHKPESEKETNADKYISHGEIRAAMSFASAYIKYAITVFIVVVGFFALLKKYPVATIIGTVAIISFLLLIHKLLNKLVANMGKRVMSEEEGKNMLHYMAVGYLSSKATLSNKQAEHFKECVKRKYQASK